MSNTRSAAKRHKQSKCAYIRNKSRRTRMRNMMRDFLSEVEITKNSKISEDKKGDKKEDEKGDLQMTVLQVKLQSVQAILAKTARLGIIKKGTYSRKVSRLYKKLNSLSA